MIHWFGLEDSRLNSSNAIFWHCKFQVLGPHVAHTSSFKPTILLVKWTNREKKRIFSHTILLCRVICRRESGNLSEWTLPCCYMASTTGRSIPSLEFHFSVPSDVYKMLKELLTKYKSFIPAVRKGCSLKFEKNVEWEHWQTHGGYVFDSFFRQT